MKRFAELYERLDMTNSTNAKVDHLVRYFETAPSHDAAWAVKLLSGDRIRSPVKNKWLRLWTREIAGISEWMFEDCYVTVGDLAETISLLVDTQLEAPASAEPLSLAGWMEDRILKLRAMDEEQKRARLVGWWSELDRLELFVVNKLMIGALRVGVSKGLVTRALAQMTGLDKATVSMRLMGRWEPSAKSFERIVSEDETDADIARPYPYFLASPLEKEPGSLGPVEDWQIEHKWDGIRGQLVKRAGEVFLWSRGEELVTEQYPEISEAAQILPDKTVLDGEIMAWQADSVLPMRFADLQRRIGRKRITRKILDEVPVRFIVYDLMESAGEDIREASQADRREALESLLGELNPPNFDLSELVEVDTWEAAAQIRETSRERLTEGMMLKRKSSPYQAGRVRGDWWKWKVEPFEIDAVLLYAQSGHGRRANLFTDYTFAVWDGDVLVPIAKAYSGLTDKEIRKLDRWIRKNTKERFGPVRSVDPHHVFTVAFEGIAPSNRHKSGIATRFPRISRWRQDKKPEDANSLEQVKALLEIVGVDGDGDA